MIDEELLGVKIRRAGKNFRVSLLGGPSQGLVAWKRTLAKLIDDKVLLEPEAGKALMQRDGDVTVYEVMNLSKSLPALKAIDSKVKVACDITLLNYGIISATDTGELFMTYGHDHEKPFGEVYSVLAGSGFLMLYQPGTNVSRAVSMRKGDEYYIPPGWVHRSYCGDEGMVLVGFVPHEAGHNYDAVKGKGFPYHIFYDEAKQEAFFRHNPGFGKSELQVLRAKKRPIGAMEKYLVAPEELRRLLEMRV